MGIVYLARDEAIGIQVAIKLLHRHFSKNESLRQRFMNEARMMAGLSHPNIVQYRHFLETDDGLALIMEYIDGRSLDHMIGSEVGPIPHEEAIPLFYQIVDGIGYAHAKGVLHRDIKPSNILVSRDLPPWTRSMLRYQYGLWEEGGVRGAEAIHSGTDNREAARG